MQPIDGGAPVALTPEGIAAGLFTPDGKKLVARDASGQRTFLPVDSPGAPEPIRFLEPADGIVRFMDSHTVLIRRPGPNGSAEISRLDLASGARAAVRTILAPPEATGTGGFTIAMSSDGTAYVFNFIATNSDLFLVKGLR